MNREEVQQLIHKHIQGELSEEDKKAFRSRMKDPAFREELTIQLALGTATAQKEATQRNTLLDYLQEIDQQAESKPAVVTAKEKAKDSIPSSAKVRPLYVRYWRQLAAAVVILGLGYFGITEFYLISNEEIAAYAEMPITGATLGEELAQSCDAIYAKAKSSGNFSDLINCLESKQANDDPLNTNEQVMLGYSYIQRNSDQKDLESALQLFNHINTEDIDNSILKNLIIRNKIITLILLDRPQDYELLMEQLKSEPSFMGKDEIETLHKRIKKARIFGSRA